MVSLKRKIDGILVMVFAIIYILASLRLEDGIVSNNQLSAATFPIMVGALLFFCGLFLIIKNVGVDHQTSWPKKQFWKKITFFFVFLFLYAFLIDYLGFFFLTFLLSSYIAVSLKGKIIPSIISSLLIIVFIHLLFSSVLEINLPLGEFWEKLFF